METVGDVVKDALQEIAVYGSELSIEPVDAQSGLRYLNRMMAAFDVDGIPLGYTESDSLGDPLTVAAGATEGIVAQLAVRLFSQYMQGEIIPPDLVQRAINGKNTMRNIAVIIAQTEYPDTLPLGSGNYQDSFTHQRFYDGVSDEVGSVHISMLSNAVQSVIAAQNTPVLVAGAWLEELVDNFSTTAAGRLTYLGKNPIDALVTVTCTSIKADAGTSTFRLRVMKNGIPTNALKEYTSDNLTNPSILINSEIQMNRNDYIELWIESTDSTSNITITNANFKVDG